MNRERGRASERQRTTELQYSKKMGPRRTKTKNLVQSKVRINCLCRVYTLFFFFREKKKKKVFFASLHYALHSIQWLHFLLGHSQSINPVQLQLQKCNDFHSKNWKYTDTNVVLEGRASTYTSSCHAATVAGQKKGRYLSIVVCANWTFIFVSNVRHSYWNGSR